MIYNFSRTSPAVATPQRAISDSASRVVAAAAKLSKLDYGKVAGHRFVDRLMETFHIRNQAELARVCDIPPAMISKVRHNTLQVQDWMLIAVHESIGVEISALKEMMRACMVNGNERCPDFVRQWRQVSGS